MARVEQFSTKSCTGREVKYNLRTEGDIYNYTNYVMKGKGKESPIYSSSNGFVSSKDNPKEISEEVQNIQKLYKKESGLRIRGEKVVIDKNELASEEKNTDLIKTIADTYSGYYVGLGYQNAYGVYDMDDCYEIRYAINSTSFADGRKYKHNDNDIREQEESCVNTIIADTLGIDIPEEQRFDFDVLEFSHFILN